MTNRRSLVRQRLGALLASILSATLAMPAHADVSAPPATLPSAEQCKALADVDFSRLPDAPTQISVTHLVETTSEVLGDLGIPAMPELATLAAKHIGKIRPYCRVIGYVVPNVGFQLLLPVDHWNGKFLHVGCGGWCGSTAGVGLACAKHPDFACIGTDMGHTGAGGLWFRNNLQAQVDFAYRATHVATIAGKAITEHYYAGKPKKSYFMGCSTGGYQGMVEAQRYPWDFDGIVAGAPDMDESDLAARGVWIKQNFIGHEGKPVINGEETEWLHEAALAKCDLDDGVKDGIISDPLHCKFDPGELQCKAGKTDHCLNAQQVNAVRNIYGRPKTSKGVPLSTRGVLPGSERLWAETFAETWGDVYFRDTALLTPVDKSWNYEDFDFDRDYPRSGAGVQFANTNPDLRKFKSAGGKLISYQGGHDTLEIPGAIFDYYETAEKTMGGRAPTQDFFRLFAVPGMNHCGDGDGPFAVDYLSYLEAWVEQGKPPDVMIGSHVMGLRKYEAFVLNASPESDLPIAFTRPLFPYPQYARYKGRGDATRAENFGPVIAR